MKPDNLISLHTDKAALLLNLPPEIAGMLFQNLVRYAQGDAMSEMDAMQTFAFEVLKQSYDALMEAREKSAEAHRQAGKTGGRPLKNKEEKPKKPNGFDENQKVSNEKIWFSDETKKSETVTVTVNPEESSPSTGSLPRATPEKPPPVDVTAPEDRSSDNRGQKTDDSQLAGALRPETELSSVLGLPSSGIPDPPTQPGHWLTWFNVRHGLSLDPQSRFDRKSFWPLATQWCRAGVTLGQMQAAIDTARETSREPIVSLPAYADRVLASQTGPPRESAAARGTLAAARTIFGTDIEEPHGKHRIIDITPTSPGEVGRGDFPRTPGQLRVALPEPVEDRSDDG